MRPPTIAGHRGAAGLAPENTLPSFRKAYDLGVRLIEFDVRLTRDGFPICFHDDRLDRVTNGAGLVSDHDLEALEALAVMPGAFGGAYPGARIPLLEEVVGAIPDDCRFLVELKADPAREKQLVRTTLETLIAAQAIERCRLISFERSLLRLVREVEPRLDPGVPTAPRILSEAWMTARALPLGPIAGRGGRDSLFERARESGACALQAHQSMVDEALVRQAHEEGFLVNAWTVNRAEEVRRLAFLGVDEITSDYPDAALGAI